MAAEVVGFVSENVGSFIDAAVEVGSAILENGQEFITSVKDTVFQALPENLSQLGATDLVGNLSGDATWFNAFNPGEIISSATSVVSEAFGAAGQSLSSVVSSASSLSDFQGYLKTASDTLNKVAPIARTVQNIAGYAGIKIPGVDILTQTAGAVNIASAGLNTVTGIASNVGKVVTAAGAVAGGESPAASIGGLVRAASSVPGLEGLSQAAGAVGKVVGGAQAVAGAESPVTAIRGLISSANPVSSAFPGFNILNDEQTAALEKVVDPKFLNRFVPVAGAPQNYDTATATVETLTPVVADLQVQVDGARLAINQENENIASFQNQLDNPDLTAEQRAEIEANIQNSYDNIALAQQAIDDTEPLIISTSEQIAQAAQLVVSTDATTTKSAAGVSAQPNNQFSLIKGVNGLYSVINKFTGAVTQTGLDAKQALQRAKDLFITGATSSEVGTAANVNPTAVPGVTADNVLGNFASQAEQDAINQASTNARNLVQEARNQKALREARQTEAQTGDWRVKLRLAPNSTYLYNATAFPGDATSGPGLMAPLKKTDGVIFPYTPAIDTAYKANYESYDLTHSNYRGYFYRNSYVDMINVRAQFTAQDTNEANYLLAVIHFFRSATKMFYGKDSQAGAPPPLVYLSGYGNFQFNEHPCVISQFNYQLPPDVDYIRAQSSLYVNTNMIGNRIRNPIANNPVSYIANRLLNNNLLPGALDFRPSQGNLPVNEPTYVPTKMEISISLLPIQSRSQISNNFSVKQFANGNLLKGGYW